MSFENIILQVDEGIATITFNRPKVLNALNSDLLEELSQALDGIGADEEIRVVVLTGSGDKAFVAGADINELRTLGTLRGKVFSQKGQGIICKLQSLPIPVVAAVNGFALGGGTEIALACDFIYASETATFGQPEIKLGLIPGFGGTQRLPRLVGSNLAKEFIFTGAMIPAEEAFRIGLVNKLSKPDALLEETYKTARSMASMGKVSLRAAKQAINRGLDVDLSTGCGIEVDTFSICLASEDAAEGTAAFLAKRQAVFKGSLK